jgi:hypothetical protein
VSRKHVRKGYVIRSPSLEATATHAVPSISLRKTAEKLGVGPSTYAVYENANLYKKPHLPIDLARKLAAIFADHGIEPAEDEACGPCRRGSRPEAAAVEAARPTIQYVPLQVALPSEGALRDMFHSLLALVPEGASRAETAEILARWLPTGFAGIGPYLPDPSANAPTVPEFRPPAAPQTITHRHERSTPHTTNRTPHTQA